MTEDEIKNSLIALTNKREEDISHEGLRSWLTVMPGAFLHAIHKCWKSIDSKTRTAVYLKDLLELTGLELSNVHVRKRLNGERGWSYAESITLLTTMLLHWNKNLSPLLLSDKDLNVVTEAVVEKLFEKIDSESETIFMTPFEGVDVIDYFQKIPLLPGAVILNNARNSRIKQDYDCPFSRFYKTVEYYLPRGDNNDGVLWWAVNAKDLTASDPESEQSLSNVYDIFASLHSLRALRPTESNGFFVDEIVHGLDLVNRNHAKDIEHALANRLGVILRHSMPNLRQREQELFAEADGEEPVDDPDYQVLLDQAKKLHSYNWVFSHASHYWNKKLEPFLPKQGSYIMEEIILPISTAINPDPETGELSPAFFVTGVPVSSAGSGRFSKSSNKKGMATLKMPSPGEKELFASLLMYYALMFRTGRSPSPVKGKLTGQKAVWILRQCDICVLPANVFLELF